MKKATTTMKKSKSGIEERRDGSIGQALTPALSQVERGEIEIDAKIKEFKCWRGETPGLPFVASPCPA